MELDFFKYPEVKDLFYRVELLRRGGKLVPSGDALLSLKLCPVERARVLILGQDPYPNPRHATGLAFSVPRSLDPADYPPTLLNVLLEAGLPRAELRKGDGDLTSWAEQGVLLWNVSPFAIAGKRASFIDDPGAIKMTEILLEALSSRSKPLVAMLWGRKAQSFEPLLTGKSTYILKAPHPSPLSASLGFHGCGHFRLANDFLRQNNERMIKWTRKDSF